MCLIFISVCLPQTFTLWLDTFDWMRCSTFFSHSVYFFDKILTLFSINNFFSVVPFHATKKNENFKGPPNHSNWMEKLVTQKFRWKKPKWGTCKIRTKQRASVHHYLFLLHIFKVIHFISLFFQSFILSPIFHSLIFVLVSSPLLKHGGKINFRYLHQSFKDKKMLFYDL